MNNPGPSCRIYWRKGVCSDIRWETAMDYFRIQLASDKREKWEALSSLEKISVVFYNGVREALK